MCRRWPRWRWREPAISREELQQKLWPGASFGDPEHGLNAAINKLREKLGDSATTPTYVETLPGRGYRFIGQLEPGAILPALGPVPISNTPAATRSGRLHISLITAAIGFGVFLTSVWVIRKHSAAQSQC
jgi:hypothetical protein